MHAAARTGNFVVRSARLFAGSEPGSFQNYPSRDRLCPDSASVFLEELMLIGAAGIDKRIHDEVEVRRISDDTDVALALFAESGWLDSPAGYHQAPTAPETFTLTPAKFLCNRYERLEFPSDYVPTPGLPGTDRWLAMEANRTVHAYVMEHRDGKPRPWLVYLHGHAMGRPMDLTVGDGMYFYRDLGYNIIAPVLPLQGPRSGELNTASLDLGVERAWVDAGCVGRAKVSGLGSRPWCHRHLDPRHVARWVHGSDGGQPRPRPDVRGRCVPAAAIHSPLTGALTRNPAVRRTMERKGIIDDRTELVHRVVTPTAMPCLLPNECRTSTWALPIECRRRVRPINFGNIGNNPRCSGAKSSHMFTMMSPRVRKLCPRLGHEKRRRRCSGTACCTGRGQAEGSSTDDRDPSRQPKVRQELLPNPQRSHRLGRQSRPQRRPQLRRQQKPQQKPQPKPRTKTSAKRLPARATPTARSSAGGSSLSSWRNPRSRALTSKA